MKDNPPRDYVFWTDCVSSVGELINEMRDSDRSRDITYETMLSHADGLLDWAKNNGYEPRSSIGHGLTLKSDWSVSYHKSFYCGVPCYYLVWSGIEYIWIKKGSESEVQACEQRARAAARPSTSLLASHHIQPRDNPDANLFADVVVPDSSFFAPDNLWGIPLLHGDAGCELALLADNPPPTWIPLVQFSKSRAIAAREILKSYGIKISGNIKTLLCLSQTRNMSCLMTAWCERFCYGKNQNFCRPTTTSVLLDNFDAFQFLATADEQAIHDVAWALMTVCTAFGIQNVRVPGIGDFTPGLLRVCVAMAEADPGFTVWGFTRKHEFALNEMPVLDNLVIWASIDATMSDRRIDQALDFAEAHGTGLSYSTELGTIYKPRNGENPEPPWWTPPLHEDQERDQEDTFLADFVQYHDLHVVFGYHGRGMTTHVGGGCPECPATDPLGGGHFIAACQECYWCIEKPSKAAHLDLVEHRLNTVAVIPVGKHQGTRVLLDTGEKA